MSRYLYTAVMSLVFCFCSAAAFAAEKASYTLAVLPNMPTVTLHKNWTPFVEHLSRELGVKIELKLYDKIVTFLEDSEAGRADFLYTAPNMYYLAYQKQKYIPLVRSATMIQGRVFVKKDSPYTKVNELQGKKIAFVGPKNVCSIITRQALLTGQGTIDYNASFTGSTINVAKSVLLGKVDAGASLDISLINDIPDMLGEFRVILETEKIASHPLATHPRVPKKLQDAVVAAVLAMDKSAQGRKILDVVKLTKPVKADFKKDYSLFSEFDFGKLDKQQAR